MLEETWGMSEICKSRKIVVVQRGSNSHCSWPNEFMSFCNWRYLGSGVED